MFQIKRYCQHGLMLGVGMMCLTVSAQHMRRPQEAPPPGRLQQPVPRGRGGDSPATVASGEQSFADPSTPDGRLEVDADRLEFDADHRILTAIGNVMIQQNQDRLQADFVEFDVETQQATARGNIIMYRGDRTWEGTELTYNFRTREGDFGEFLLFYDPFYITARESRQISPEVVELEGARVSTCSADQRQEFLVRARRATVTDGHVLRARHAVAQLYGIPIFYTPFFKRDFNRESNWQFVPGYASRMGAFLLSSYNFAPAPGVESSTMLDYRTKRGVAGGQRFRWNLPDQGMRGRFQAYYADDDRPIRSERQAMIREGLVDNDRYWFGFQHSQRLAERNLILADLNYVSDPFMLEDFFDREFRRNVQPPNRVSLTHRGDNFSAGILLNLRLNDFYENVNRLPEVSLDIFRQELGETGFFYESEHRGSNLERVFPDLSEEEDYDALRADTVHTVLYPTRMAGFLNVIPRASYRGTWYSAAPEFITITDIIPQFDDDGELLVDEQGLFIFDEEETTVVEDGGAQFRSLFEFGVDTSFKAFRVLNERPNYLGTGLRHIVEPSARYTWVPEPNLRPNELYQFDVIDRLDQRHDIRLGMRNKLQTRRVRGKSRLMTAMGEEWMDSELEDAEPVTRGRQRVHDFVDLETFTFYRLDPDEDQEIFDDFFFNSRLRLADWVNIDFDGAYDWYDNELRLFNSSIRFFADDRSSLGLEYRYNRDRRQMAQADVVLFPRGTWSYQAYWRFDLEESELEEQRYLVQRRFDCTVLGVGVRGRLADGDETEWRVWAHVALLALPRLELRLGG